MNKPERPDPVFRIKFESDDPEEQKKEMEEILRFIWRRKSRGQRKNWNE